MKRKIISLFTLLAFIVFSISCYVTSLKEVRTAADLRGKKGKIKRLVKTSGEHIEFSKNGRGRIYGDKIVGTIAVISKKVEITRDNIKKVKRDENGKVLEITHKNGKTYPVNYGSVKEVSIKDDLTGKEEERIIFFTTPYETYESVSIPLSEVKSVRIKNFDFIASLFVAGAVIGLGVAALAIGLSGTELIPRL
jgi:hypothetical protein